MSLTRTCLCWAALLAATAVVAGCSGEEPADRAAADETATASAATPTPSPTGWTPLTDDGSDPLLPGPGRYGMVANGRPDAPWAVVRVPEGFSHLGTWAMFDEKARGGPGMGYWTVSEVDRHPCEILDGDPMDAGTTVEDLVAALAEQEQTIRSRPVPTVLDGHKGVYLEIRVPDIDVSRCANAEYFVWESDPAGARHMESAGTVDRLWIVDVDGEVVVFNTTASSDVPKRAFDRMSQIVESVEFVRWP